MDASHLFFAVGATLATVVGGTWALRSKLGDIEIALKGHVVKDDAVHEDHQARIIKLEGRRRR